MKANNPIFKRYNCERYIRPDTIEKVITSISDFYETFTLPMALIVYYTSDDPNTREIIRVWACDTLDENSLVRTIYTHPDLMAYSTKLVILYHGKDKQDIKVVLSNNGYQLLRDEVTEDLFYDSDELDDELFYELFEGVIRYYYTFDGSDVDGVTEHPCIYDGDKSTGRFWLWNGKPVRTSTSLNVVEVLYKYGYVIFERGKRNNAS